MAYYEVYVPLPVLIGGVILNFSLQALIASLNICLNLGWYWRTATGLGVPIRVILSREIGTSPKTVSSMFTASTPLTCQKQRESLTNHELFSISI